MLKAGKLEVGETSTVSAARRGTARLVLLASDASDNARKRAEGCLAGRRALLVPLPFSKDTLSRLLSKSGCSMAAVTDLGLASAFLSALAQEEPGRYGGQAEEMKRRKDRAARRRAEGPKRKAGGNKV